MIEIAQSTPTSSAIAALVEQHYAFGPVVQHEFLRRSFNQVYGLRFADGRRAVARLCADRPRGAANLTFEAAALAHWSDRGCVVSRCLPATDGSVSIKVPLPEGCRAMALFEFLEGEATGKAPERIAAFGQGLASLHAAGEGYAGPASRYALDLDYLIRRPLQTLLDLPTLSADLGVQFEAIGQRLLDRIQSLGALAQVLCHGDAHGENNFVVDGCGGALDAHFFDFDEAGPGFLAYELAVYPWSLHPRAPDAKLTDERAGQWEHFIRAYRDRRPVAEADLAAIPRFMAARQIWLLGEYAGRTATWGTQTMPTDYLRRQVTTLRQWDEGLLLPLTRA